MKQLRNIDGIIGQHRAYTDLRNRLNKHLKGADLNAAKFLILSCIYKAKRGTTVRPSDIAEELGLERASVSRTLSSLVDDGRLVYTFNEKDRREVFVAMDNKQRGAFEAAFNGFKL